MKDRIIQFVKNLPKRKGLLAIIIIVLIGIIYFGFKAKGGTEEISYNLSSVSKGTLITSVSGSGQVTISKQVDLKPKASGQIISVNVKKGDKIKTGTVIAKIDPKDANKNIRDAALNLESAKISLEKLKASASANSLLQAQNALQTAKDNLAKLKLSQESNVQKSQDAKQKAEDAITKGYEDAYNNIADAFLDLPTIITELYDILYSTEISTSTPNLGQGGMFNVTTLMNQTNVEDRDELQPVQVIAEADYKTAREKYDVNFTNYKNSTRYANKEQIETLLEETLETTKSIAQAAKSESNFLDTWADLRSKHDWVVFDKVKTYQTNLSTYIGQTNNHLISLLSTKTTLKDNADAVASAERDLKQLSQNNPLDIATSELTIKDKEIALADLQDGSDPLDIKAQELTIQQRKNSLEDAQSALSDYSITAPFDCIVADVNVVKGDTASTGTAVASLITDQLLADISLNEVDIAKIKLGQKATLEFDALDGVTITGAVVEMDSVGTTSQGVVTYNVTIAFDVSDDGIKPGMSVSASIITDAKQDVLLVPNAAVKTQGNYSYVEVFDSTTIKNAKVNSDGGIITLKTPTRKEITKGASNDTNTEISGENVKEGDQVVIKTSSSKKVTNSTSSSGFRLPGVSGGSPGR